MTITGAHLITDGVPHVMPVMVVTVQVEGRLRTLAEVERDVIRNAIDHHGGNYTAAAKALGIGRSTLYRKMEEAKT